MNDTSPPERDDLDDLLRPADSFGPNDPLRQALRQRTTSVLRRRRYLKRLGLVAALAACYLAGLASMRFWMPPPNPTPVPQVKKEDSLREPPAPTPQQPRIDEVPVKEAELTAIQLEREGELADREKRAGFYRKAGDRYLEMHGDAQSALRCYRVVLDVGTEEDLAISPGDNWLLISLKNARLKEIRHVPTNG